MDKLAIKSFAVEARRKMIENVKYRANLLGITADEIKDPISKAEGMETYNFGAGTFTIYNDDIKKRENLINEIKCKGFDNVVEEVAYTWFNRIIAIRFMEVNDYLPTRTRVLSSESEGKKEPDIITEALDLDLDYSDEDRDLIIKLKDDNRLDELFQFLFIKQCNKLNDILPGLFRETDDYLEILLNLSFTDEEGIIRLLIDTISEEDFGNQVEIIGWLYQFYNSELKSHTDKNFNNVPKDRIPSVTQLFTPEWIVKYLVENSIGRLWLENHPNNDLKSKWIYYVEDYEQEADVKNEISIIKERYSIKKPEDIKIIDPCMGSGHILVYVFDVLMQIYLSEGYTANEASILILENNIHGLDIDDRAYQLTYFALMMKARSINRKLFEKNISPLISSIQESNMISNEAIDFIDSMIPNVKNDLNYLKNVFKDSKEYGSILDIDKLDFSDLKYKLNKLSSDKYSNLTFLKYKSEINQLLNLVDEAYILSNKYDVVITNPPYLATKKMNGVLKKFLRDHYPISKGDLCVVFIEKCQKLAKQNGFISMITQHSFMFLSSYQKMRMHLLKSTLINLNHLGPGAFEEIKGEKVQTVSFIFRNSSIKNYKSTFINLLNSDSKEEDFFNEENKYIFDLTNVTQIFGSPFAYWIDEDWLNIFKNGTVLEDICDVKAGLATADNNRFLRFWYEVDLNKIGFNFKTVEDTKHSFEKWFPYNKGGDYKKWYGNHYYVVDWSNDGRDIKNFKDKNGKLKSRPQNTQYYFKKSISWSLLGSPLGIRCYPEGFIFDVNGSSLFPSNEDYYYIVGCLGSKMSTLLLSILNPTLAFQVGNIKSIPIIYDSTHLEEITDLVTENIKLSKLDWDDYEISWNFLRHPLLRFDGNNLENIFNEWFNKKNEIFNLVKSNEIKLNSIFSQIYNVDIDCDVEDKYISIVKPNHEKDVISFISYAIGCIFGRYSLDNEGIVFAGGEFDLNDYSKFIPDDDNIIPVLDTEYFEDDIVGRFVDFVKTCFGEENLEENLNFIAGALNKKGNTSREVIRNYFLTDFFKSHAQLYNKCPIYWQFDSGKHNAFKCLIYMHRYEPNIIARVRADYLHKTQKAIDENLAHCETIIAKSTNKSELKQARKDKDKFIKQLKEIKDYDEVLAHMANQQINIDLDVGVKVNYAKFQNIEIAISGQKTKKVNLLKKI